MAFIRKVKAGKHTYLAEVKSVREGNKVKQKFIRYVGKEIDGTRILSGSVEDSEVTSVKIYGPLLVLNEISRKIDLHSILKKCQPEILSMVYSHCVDPKSLNKMEEWFSKTELNQILNLNELTERKLVDALDSISNDGRNEMLQEDIFESVNSKYHLEKKSFFYDVTNIYFFGTNCKIAKRSKSKEGGYRRIVQIGLAVTDEGIPIFHKVFSGNVFDARTLFDIMKTLSYSGIQTPYLIWDRGVSSKINISNAKKLGFHIICGLAKRGKLPQEADEILETKDLIKPKNRVQLKETSFYVRTKNYKCDKVPGYLYICLNRKQRVELQEKRLKEIENAKKLLKKNKPIKGSLQKLISKKGNLLEKKIMQEEKYDGISLIFSSRKLTKEEVVKKYFEKDIVEKAFACLKGVIRIRPVRKWLEERVRAHIFICYLSYLLLSIFNYILAKKELQMGAVEALEKLETMYKIHMHNPHTGNKFEKTVMLTKNQEKILRAVNKSLLKM